jgi:hypothetical protein
MKQRRSERFQRRHLWRQRLYCYCFILLLSMNQVPEKLYFDQWSYIEKYILTDGPIQIEISPPDNTYTVTETGSVNQITCTADCNPSCTTTWTGPNLPAGSTSILNLNNIDRSQAGTYNCTAVNEISSLTLIKVNVIVNCKYEMSMVY